MKLLFLIHKIFFLIHKGLQGVILDVLLYKFSGLKVAIEKHKSINWVGKIKH